MPVHSVLTVNLLLPLTLEVFLPGCGEVSGPVCGAVQEGRGKPVWGEGRLQTRPEERREEEEGRLGWQRKQRGRGAGS